MNKKNISNIIKSIYFMGPEKFILRLYFEIVRLLERIIPQKILFFIYSSNGNIPNFSTNIDQFIEKKFFPFRKKIINKKAKLEFNFLNQTKYLTFPGTWNNKNWDRLWQFNLHYFNWTIDWIIESISIGNWSSKGNHIEYLIDDWIKNNKIGFGDGWHSYTISIRIRNLSCIYRYFPELRNQTRIESLWIQLNWLDNHIEFFHKGNHLLENLISLLFVSIQFEGQDANNIFNRNLELLRLELDKQIMNDGGHIERSAAYHLIILERLSELALIIRLVKSYIPGWLNQKIKLMNNWVEKIKLLNNRFPDFNDSALDISNNIDTVLYKSKAALNEKQKKEEVFKIINSKIDKVLKKTKNKKNNSIQTTILENTGWAIFRLKDSWEITFKWGIAGFKKSSGHINADLSSINIYYDGKPILSEAGTSVYKDCSERSYERSGSSKNSIQVASFNKDLQGGIINWEDSIETWGSFGTGRIPNIESYKLQKINNKKIIFSSSHDGFFKQKIEYQRKLIIEIKEKLIYFEVIDSLNCKNKKLYKLSWHEGPNLNKRIINLIMKNEDNKVKKFTSYKINPSKISDGFGRKINRISLTKVGVLNKGLNTIQTRLILPILID